MNLKITLFFIGLLTTTLLSPDLETIRKQYRMADNNEEATKKLFGDLSSIGKNDSPTAIAYKGAVTTMMSKYADGFKDKKDTFKQGRELLEEAVTAEPENVEIRCIRLSVQENVPKITGYKKNIDTDKQFIIANFSKMGDNGAKSFVKGYISQSKTFTEAEKQLF